MIVLGVSYPRQAKVTNLHEGRKVEDQRGGGTDEDRARNGGREGRNSGREGGGREEKEKESRERGGTEEEKGKNGGRGGGTEEESGKRR